MGDCRLLIFGKASEFPYRNARPFKPFRIYAAPDKASSFLPSDVFRRSSSVSDKMRGTCPSIPAFLCSADASDTPVQRSAPPCSSERLRTTYRVPSQTPDENRRLADTHLRAADKKGEPNMKNRILRPAVMLAAGLLLGVASRLLDLYTQNPGNIFSQMAVWILLGTLISIYSPTPARAMANILPFCLGMLVTYYATAMLTDGVYSRDNLYNSNVTEIDFMDRFKFEEIVIPERTYAVFETEKKRMPIPEYFDIRKQIAAVWLSNEEYQMINAPELAVYHWGIVGGYADRTIEIWIPIEKK